MLSAHSEQNLGGTLNRTLICSLGSASLIAIMQGSVAHAQAVARAVAPAEEATLGEIVVTARRRSESLQEVPQTVNAIPADTIQKLSLTTFQDIQTVVPGLTLTQGNSPVGASASLRGVTFGSLTTGGQPTVAEYINEVPVNPVQMFQSLFDVGQVEVLKGPQGTARGVSAPSGAITLTTRRPDLSRFGGYMSAQATDLQGRNVQGAINIPIIKDVLAVRLAGVVDQNDNDGVRSINSTLKPYDKSTGERISISYEPSDAFNANVTYQHLNRTLGGFQPVVGSGHGINPPITADMRVGVQDDLTTFRQQFDSVSAQFDSRIFGQHLSYVGSYNFFKFKSLQSQDTANGLPFIDPQQFILTTAESTTHELRLASDPAPGRFFDYVVGAFYSWQAPQTVGTQPASYLPGAFGPPNLPPNTAAFNPSFAIPVGFGGPPSSLQETSVFGNVTFHLPWDTELSGGIRHIMYVTTTHLVTELGDGQIALPASIFGGNCGARASTYPGFCDFPLSTAAVISNTSGHTSDHPNVYNVSLSHRVNRDLLIYANTGTSWQPPEASFSLQGGITASTNPDIRRLTFHPAETSRAYEVGFKSTFLDQRARLNVALFRQRYTGLYIGIPGISYFNDTNNGVTQQNMQVSVDALVQGFDVDAAWQITPEWSLSAQLSYAHSEIEGSLVPCNVPGAVLNNPNFVSFCPGSSASRLPLWNLTAQSEYVHPLADNVDGFVRGLFNYYPQNKYVEPNFAAPSYALLDLFAGVRSHDGAWEASAFVRNIGKTSKLLDRNPQETTLGGLVGQFPTLNQPTGYTSVLQYTPRREVGVSVRYAWGSR
jgi:iron complex outermembrane receptor protein